MSRTSKPCPGCGKVDPRRPADKVCFSCQLALEKYPALREENKKLVTQYKLVPSDFNKRTELRGAYADINNAILELVSDMPTQNGVAMIPEGLDLHRLYRTVLDVAEREHKRGKDYGTSLLVRLNDGEISPSDFEHHKQYGR